MTGFAENSENIVRMDPNTFGTVMSGVAPKSGPKVKGVYRCPKQSNLQNKSVEARPFRYWGLLDCHCRWWAPRLRSLEDRQ